MKKLFKLNSNLFVLLAFLPITPSIAAITVFTHSLLNDENTEKISLSHHTRRVIDSSRY